jgi:hypothetical protein
MLQDGWCILNTFCRAAVVQGNRIHVATDIETTAEPVVGIDQAVLIHMHIVDLDAESRSCAGLIRNCHSDAGQAQTIATEAAAQDWVLA